MPREGGRLGWVGQATRGRHNGGCHGVSGRCRLEASSKAPWSLSSSAPSYPGAHAKAGFGYMLPCPVSRITPKIA